MKKTFNISQELFDKARIAAVLAGKNLSTEDGLICEAIKAYIQKYNNMEVK